MTKPVLIVDKRQDTHFTEALRQHFEVTERVLKTGDLLWSCPLGTVGVEDKCSNDLTGSRRNGRLDDELRRLVATYALPILFVRNTHLSPYARWSGDAVENLLFGRQLYGVYVYHAAGTPLGAAESLLHLYEYTQRPGFGLDGVRREAKRRYAGPMAVRAEAVYGILGLVPGIRNRRAVAQQIASETSLTEFLNWSVSDFTFAGFTALMGRKLVATIQAIEGKANWKS